MASSFSASGSASWVAALRRVTRVRTDEAALAAHAGDAWMARALPEAVALPADAGEVAAVLRLASARGIAVTPRGGGRGYVGGCVPRRGGIVLSLARMNRILRIHKRDGVAVVQPAVVTGRLQRAVEARGLFYPPDPASLDECWIGGNIATNAGGPRCIKYGVTRQYVLGLQVALADGALVRVGGRTLKNKQGFDLVGMFVGSEGLLGVVTEATLRLLPLPPARALIVAGFRDARAAANGVQAIFEAGFLPCACEIADSFTLEAARRYVGAKAVPSGDACLLVELDGQPASVRQEGRALAELVRRSGGLDVISATEPAERERLWGVRRSFSYSLRATGLHKLNEDVTVPRSRLVDLIALGGRLQRKYRIAVATFGHAGDGNLHVNLMIKPGDRAEAARAKKALDELFAHVLDWGGVLTGEHGIGLAKLPWWKRAASPEVRRLHAALKSTLDPKGILNPGKFVESHGGRSIPRAGTAG